LSAQRVLNGASREAVERHCFLFKSLSMSSGTSSFGVCALCAALFGALLVGRPSAAGAWATITVNSLADPGEPGICALRDAITAANTMTATNGCVAGKGHDTIVFSVTGTIKLTETLPWVTDSNLTINGPASPGITIDGGGAVQVMAVFSPITLKLDHLTIAHGAGGIAVFGATAIISNSTFSANGLSFGSGGGIESEDSTLTVTNSTFSDNGADAGAGIDISGGTATISDSTFSRNTVGHFGGGIVIFPGTTATISNSTFSGNSTTFGGGGGIAVFGGTAIISNSTFSGSTGGGILINSGNAAITNSTFSGNTGGAIDNLNSASVKGTVIAGQASGGNCSGPITDLGYNISDDDSCGFTATGSLNDTDPMLDPAGLSNNGGPTQTIALVSGSPAIDAIPLASCTDQDGNPLTTDQRGFPRPDAGENVCDVGAYEFQDFAGDPGTASCIGRSMSALQLQYRRLRAAAMRFGSVRALQTAIRTFCNG
jgi:hypothetical protein